MNKPKTPRKATKEESSISEKMKKSVKDVIEIKATKEESSQPTLSSDGESISEKISKSAPGLPKISVKDLIERKARKDSSKPIPSSDSLVEASVMGKKKKYPTLSFLDDVEYFPDETKVSKLPGDLRFRKRVPPPPTRPSLWNLKKEYSDEKEHSKEKKHSEEKGHWFDRFEKPTPPGQGVNQIFREVLDNDKSKLTASAEICKARSRYGTVVSCRGRWDAEMVWDYLTREGFYASRWHGGLKKLQQERSEMDFKKGTFNVYVVTEDLFHWMDPPTRFTLLNFDLPVHFEDYKRMLLKFGTIYNLISKKSGGMCLIKLIHSGIAVPPFVKMIYEETTIDRKE